MKKRKTSIALLLCLAMLMFMVTGCGGGSDDTSADEGRGDVVTDGAEDYYGCWEYYSYDIWLVINSDGTYDWYYDDGSYASGDYSVGGDCLTITTDDGEIDYSFNADGELVDSDGDELFASSLPDFSTESTVNAEDFYGCWEYYSYDIWLVINSDGTYDWYYDDGSYASGDYSVGGDCLTITTDDGEIDYSFNADGELVDSDGDELFASSLPDFSTESTVNAEDFYGCWEYTTEDVWVYIYGDGTYETFDETGSVESGEYYMDGDYLCFYDSEMEFYLDDEGYMIDNDGDALFQSELPDFT